MKKQLVGTPLLFIAFFLALLPFSHAQEAITWHTLKDVSWIRKHNKEYDEYINYPKFGNTLRKYEHKQVIITGYFLPVEVEGDYIVLSAFPFQSCFFCGGAGIESVMEVYLKKNKKLRKDAKIQVKGTLILNEKDVEHLVYLLKDAEIIDAPH